MRIYLFLCIILISVSSCSPILNGAKVRNLTNNYCSPTIVYDYSKIDKTENINPKTDSILSVNLSTHDIFISKAIGASSYLVELFQLKNDTLKQFILKQKIANRLNLTNSEIEAIAAELDCNGERIDELANYVGNINSNKNTTLTVASVTLGALTTVATVLINTNSNANTIAGVSGGLVSAGLGALTINPKGKRIKLPIQRNLLGSIWFNNNENNFYSPTIWKILNEKSLTNSGKITLRESIKNRWLEFEFDGKVDIETEKLFFKDGGIYTADDLHARADMLNELQASVRAIQQDLRSLFIKLNEIK